MTADQSKSFDRAFDHIGSLAPDHGAPTKKKKEAPLITDSKAMCLAELRKAEKLSAKFETEIKELIDRSSPNPYTAAFKKDLSGKNKGLNIIDVPGMWKRV